MSNQISIYQGNTKTIKFTATNKAGEPVDLTSYDCQFLVKRQFNSNDFIISRESYSKSGNIALFKINSADTTDLTGSCIYEIVISKTDFVCTVIQDQFNIKDSILV